MTAALEIDGLVKKFGGLTATDHVSFAVAEGESVGLIGPNGAGKTTIFSQIMGDLRQTQGVIRLFGEDISRMATHVRIRKGVGRTYQVPRPFGEMTVLENIRIGLMPDDLWKMMTKAPDMPREQALAQQVGLRTADWQRTPGELAMGDLRKLEFARTLATGARFLLLDEVFAGLTHGEIAQISEQIQLMRAQGMTFLIVSHDLKALEPLVDRVIALDRGRKIAEGSFDDVLADPQVRASYLGVA